MASNENTRVQNASTSSGAVSSPMVNTGSKGRSSGSKFKSLLAKLSGGHGSKSSKPVAGSGTGGSSPTGGHADEATSSTAKGSVKNNIKPEASSNKPIPLTQSSRASKQGVSHNTGKMTVSKDSKGKAVTSKDMLQRATQSAASKESDNNPGHIHPAADLSAVPTQSTNPVDYFGLKGTMPAQTNDAHQQKFQDDSNSDLDALRYRAENPEYEDDEMDGADADASIRPITPSSIDASSSFTGSTSLHSLAPTSRTFKSFRTGHSKTSASTKPTLLGANGTSVNAPSAGGGTNGNAPSATSPISNGQSHLQEASSSPPNSERSLHHTRKDGTSGPSLTLQSDKQREKSKAIEATIDTPVHGPSSLGMVDMHDPDANRIATSLHGAEGTIPSSPRSVRSSGDLPAAIALPSGPLQAVRHGPKASPLRNSFVGPVSGLAVAPALSAAEEESETGSQVPQQSTPRDHDWTDKQQDDDTGDMPDGLRMPEAHRVDSADIVRSSASITFSKLPPATPASISSAHLYSAPESPGRLSSHTQQTNTDRPEDEVNKEAEGIYHYPRHSAPDPRNNPRASSPPPDNASMLTLASSTGGRAPSIYTAASRYRDGISGGGPGSIGGAPSIVDTAGHRYRTTANEDASIRAIAPSRRESTDSIGSKWSAAILSQRDGSYHAPSIHAPVGSTSAGDMIPDNASYKRKTPSLRTVATTASSYYAAPIASSTELRA